MKVLYSGTCTNAKPETFIINQNYKRLRLFEFKDLPWFPDVIREGMVDYLKFILGKLNFYKPFTKLIADTLEKSGQTEIVDLCSGGGGTIIQVQENLKEITNRNFKITLTDKFPNIPAS